MTGSRMGRNSFQAEAKVVPFENRRAATYWS
jgi:hypothetical protein